MKLMSLIWMLGLRPAPKTFGTKLLRFHLDRDGDVEYAKWLHPKDYFQPFDQSLMDRLREYIRPGDTVLDIGAHCGDFTVPLSLAAGRAGCVFAFEPNPFVFEVLQQNANLNRSSTHIVPVQAAVGTENGSLLFHYSDPGFCNGGCLAGISPWRHGHPFEMKVPSIRLVDWLATHHPERLSNISFIKIDTEGYDLTVLRSMEPLIHENHPYLHIEMYRHLSLPRRHALHDELVRLGYDAFHAEGRNGMRAGQQLTGDNLMQWEHYDVLAFPKRRHAVRLVA